MKNNDIMTLLLNKKIYILSPHFDDAILSAGMLMYSLNGKAKITVVNIFTKAHSGPYTLSAKQFLQRSGFNNANKLYTDRQLNDKAALSMVGAKAVDLGLTDALFRKKRKQNFFGRFIPEFNHYYPTYRWHILKNLVKNDSSLIQLESKLSKIIPQNSLLIVPFGTGNHTDHVITRLVAEKVYKNIYYYMDFPYNLRLKTSGKAPAGYKKIILDTDLNVKTKLISLYTSQIKGLFKEGKVPKHKEIFFIK